MHIGQSHAGPGAPRSGPPNDRRQPPAHSARGRLRWLRGLMLRPFRLRWRGGGPRLVWVERRQASAPEVDLARLRTDLQAELLTHENATLVLRELVQVDAALARAGWAGLAALPARVLDQAHMQADMLAESTGSVPLTRLARRLHALQMAADSREATVASPSPARYTPRPALPGELDETVEVSELGEDDYVQAEQAWASSQPAELGGPTKDGELKA